jgi:hypothetical protein
MGVPEDVSPVCIIATAVAAVILCWAFPLSHLVSSAVFASVTPFGRKNLNSGAGGKAPHF